MINLINMSKQVNLFVIQTCLTQIRNYLLQYYKKKNHTKNLKNKKIKK